MEGIRACRSSTSLADPSRPCRDGLGEDTRGCIDFTCTDCLCEHHPSWVCGTGKVGHPRRHGRHAFGPFHAMVQIRPLPPLPRPDKNIRPSIWPIICLFLMRWTREPTPLCPGCPSFFWFLLLASCSLPPPLHPQPPHPGANLSSTHQLCCLRWFGG